jgi:hypothetical protein
MIVAEYMNLRCMCGLLRSDHVHSYSDLMLPDGTLNPAPSQLRVITLENDCSGFTWELERELGGNPLANRHLRPLMVDGN